MLLDLAILIWLLVSGYWWVVALFVGWAALLALASLIPGPRG